MLVMSYNIVTKNDDGPIAQARIKQTFTTDIEVVAINKTNHFTRASEGLLVRHPKFPCHLNKVDEDSQGSLVQARHR